ncbi:MAG: LysM peptidoglycan-binding domain-containing protein [Gammaproteobacteria bacterium]|nr:LysM peptidoglycan-binding domain-containing protein [Gammaproteobacteria bacterium]
MAKKSIVNTHDTLWDLSKKFYGNPTLWPLIYEYNNLPRITKKTGSRIIDPDLAPVFAAIED